jgi:ribonucleoside-diphosphate reductase alpha chain
MTNAKAYGMKIVATNPCGEQPLAPYSVCNLSAINLSNFVNKSTGEVLYDKLKSTVTICIRLQDNVIDATHYFDTKKGYTLPKNSDLPLSSSVKEQALGERRIGLGVMGLHDLLL